MMNFLIYYSLASYLIVFVIFFCDIYKYDFAKKEIPSYVILFFISPLIVLKVVREKYLFFKWKKKLNLK